MIELPSLYDHQSSLVANLRHSLAKHKQVILCAPPGCGKTRMSKWILGNTLNREPSDGQSGRSLFAVHRRGLVQNASNSYGETPAMPHGVLMSGVAPNYYQRIQIASIDTILARWIEGTKYESEYTFDLVCFDETHSHLAKLRKFLVAHNATRNSLGLKPAFVVGLTATPQCQGLADVYHDIVSGPSTQWLIDNEFLSPFRYFRATNGDLSKLKKRGGEFTNKSNAEAFDGMSGDLVRDWKRLAEGRPTIGFFPRRTHAQEARDLLRQHGLRAEYVDGNTPDEQRDELYDALNNHRLDYLCNVQVIERGTDIPAASCVQICTAVNQVARWRQILGRGSRTSPGKTDCVVLDHGGNLKRGLGFFEDDPHWTLDLSTDVDGEVAARPTLECPKCQAVYRGGECRQCGYTPTPRERRAQGLEFDGSELREVKKTESKAAAKSPEQLIVSAIYKSGRSNKTWGQCCFIFRSMNKQQGTSYSVPREFTVGGRTYRSVPYGSTDSAMRVKHLYPFTTGSHGGKYKS